MYVLCACVPYGTVYDRARAARVSGAAGAAARSLAYLFRRAGPGGTKSKRVEHPRGHHAPWRMRGQSCGRNLTMDCKPTAYVNEHRTNGYNTRGRNLAGGSDVTAASAHNTGSQGGSTPITPMGRQCQPATRHQASHVPGRSNAVEATLRPPPALS